MPWADGPVRHCRACVLSAQCPGPLLLMCVSAAPVLRGCPWVAQCRGLIPAQIICMSPRLCTNTVPGSSLSVAHGYRVDVV